MTIPPDYWKTHELRHNEILLLRKTRGAMATGKYLSLEEARRKDLLKRFVKEHPTKGDKKAFDDLLERMATEKPSDKRQDEPAC